MNVYSDKAILNNRNSELFNQLMRSASISSSEAAGPAFAADTGAAGNTSGFIFGAEGKSRFPISSSCFTFSDSSYSSSSIRAFN